MKARTPNISRLVALGSAGLALVLALVLVRPVGGPSAADAQTKCGSTEQVVDMIAGDLFGKVWGRLAGGTSWLDVIWAGTAFKRFENPGDAFNRCFPGIPGDGNDPDPGEPPSGPPQIPWKELGEGWAFFFGDPHLRTTDGVSYDFQAAGDYQLVRHDATDLEIHTRFRRQSAQSSVTFGVDTVVRVGDEVVEVRSEAGGYVTDSVLVNGESVGLVLGGRYLGDAIVVTQTGRGLVIATDDGFVVRFTGSAVYVEPPLSAKGELSGLLGDFDGDPANDLQLLDGSVIDAGDNDVLYGQFLDTWLLSDADSLISEPFDEATMGPVRPLEFVTLADLDPDAVMEAEALCRAAGLLPGQGLEGCVFDVALTGDESWVEPSLATTQADPAVSAVLLLPSVEDTVELVLDPLVDELVTGSLDERGAADEFVVPAAEGELRVLRTAEPCADFVAPSAAVVINGTIVAEYSMRCGTTTLLPDQAHTLRIVAPLGGTPDYAFTVGPVETVDLGVIADGGAVETMVEPVQRVSAELDFEPGSPVFIKTLGGACGLITEVRNGDGTVLASTATCFDLGLVELTGPAPFSIGVDSSRRGGGSFGVEVTIISDVPTLEAALGDEVSVEIASPGQAGSVIFAGEADQRIYVEVLETVGIDGVTLTAPDGELILSMLSFSNSGTLTLPADGSYELRIDPSGAATGTQRWMLHVVADDAELEAELGDEVAFDIATPGQAGSVVFDADAAQRMYIQVLDSVGIGRVTLTTPSGEVLANPPAFGNTGLVVAPETGTYTVALEPTGATGTQRWIIHAVPDDVVVEAELGDEVSLEIETPGHGGSVVFEAKAGQRIFVDLLSSVGIGRVVLSAPDGEVLANPPAFGSIGDVEAPQDGLYTLRFEPSGSSGTQAWRIRAEE